MTITLGMMEQGRKNVAQMEAMSRHVREAHSRSGPMVSLAPCVICGELSPGPMCTVCEDEFSAPLRMPNEDKAGTEQEDDGVCD